MGVEVVILYKVRKNEKGKRNSGWKAEKGQESRRLLPLRNTPFWFFVLPFVLLPFSFVTQSQ
jgi:hypothetical protein